MMSHTARPSIAIIAIGNYNECIIFAFRHSFGTAEMCRGESSYPVHPRRWGGRNDLSPGAL